MGLILAKDYSNSFSGIELVLNGIEKDYEGEVTVFYINSSLDNNFSKKISLSFFKKDTIINILRPLYSISDKIFLIMFFEKKWNLASSVVKYHDNNKKQPYKMNYFRNSRALVEEFICIDNGDTLSEELMEKVNAFSKINNSIMGGSVFEKAMKNSNLFKDDAKAIYIFDKYAKFYNKDLFHKYGNFLLSQKIILDFKDLEKSRVKGEKVKDVERKALYSFLKRYKNKYLMAHNIDVPLKTILDAFFITDVVIRDDFQSITITSIDNTKSYTIVNERIFNYKIIKKGMLLNT